MTAAADYRGVPMFVWKILCALVVGAVLFFAGRRANAAIRQDERERINGEAAVTSARFALERALTARRIDSLTQLKERADTVLRTRVRIVHDTSWLPVDTSPTVRYAACRAQLDTLAIDCETFRARAGEQLAATTEAWNDEKAAGRATSLQLATARRSAERQATQHKWERRVCAASVIGNVFQWRTR